jgi:hypothetical protein
MLKSLFRNSHKFKYQVQNFQFSFALNRASYFDLQFQNQTQTKFDRISEEFSIYIQAFLQKRRISKDEVPPKIAVLKQNNLFQSQYKSQLILEEREKIPFNTLAVTYDNMDLNSSYIRSIFFEEHEEALYKAILQKKLINGYEFIQEDTFLK